MKELRACRKQYTADQDKALHPRETVRLAKERFSRHDQAILQKTERIDTGRLGIPVFLSVCGPQAREVLPTRKQMGKGASAEQAEASALMELVERFSLFSSLSQPETNHELTWSEAEKRYGHRLLPLEEILCSVHEDLEPERARAMLDLVRWQFRPAGVPGADEPAYLPVDWFYALNEFNGSAAGNTLEEAVLQAGCELVERHVCALIERHRPVLPTIDHSGLEDPVLKDLLAAYSNQGIQVLLKDFSLDFGLPTVGALVYDPATFPEKSEIVLTAGTATSPHKAAVRALTEVAQLAGDFETGSCYDPSGLSKPSSLEDCRWLESGPLTALSDLPDIQEEDFLAEIVNLKQCLADKGFSWYCLDTTHPDLDIPACYAVVPGFLFRERTERASLGLFIGRLLAEQYEPEEAERGLTFLEGLQPGAFYLPFYRGMVKLRSGELQAALEELEQAEGIQPSPEEQGLVAFYRGFAHSQAGQWDHCLPHLDRAIALSPHVHAYYNLRGVAHFKREDFRQAADDFQRALSLDSGSATDLANLGLCHQRLGNSQEAISCLQTSLELDPQLDFASKALQDLLTS